MHIWTQNNLKDKYTFFSWFAYKERATSKELTHLSHDLFFGQKKTVSPYRFPPVHIQKNKSLLPLLQSVLRRQVYSPPLTFHFFSLEVNWWLQVSCKNIEVDSERTRSTSPGGREVKCCAAELWILLITKCCNWDKFLIPK